MYSLVWLEYVQIAYKSYGKNYVHEERELVPWYTPQLERSIGEYHDS